MNKVIYSIHTHTRAHTRTRTHAHIHTHTHTHTHTQWEPCQSGFSYKMKLHYRRRWLRSDPEISPDVWSLQVTQFASADICLLIRQTLSRGHWWSLAACPNSSGFVIKASCEIKAWLHILLNLLVWMIWTGTFSAAHPRPHPTVRGRWPHTGPGSWREGDSAEVPWPWSSWQQRLWSWTSFLPLK